MLCGKKTIVITHIVNKHKQKNSNARFAVFIMGKSVSGFPFVEIGKKKRKFSILGMKRLGFFFLLAEMSFLCRNILFVIDNPAMKTMIKQTTSIVMLLIY